MKISLALIAFFLAARGAIGPVHQFDEAHRAQVANASEALYLPSGEGLGILSVGYRNALSHLLWFRTISYFGKQFKGDRNYQWLAHMCDLVTTLNPGARHVFEFGAMMLAWEVNQPKRSIALLDKAIAAEPDYWRYYYLRGFTRYYFLDDPAGASVDFARSAKCPEAPAFVASLAARKMVQAGEDPESAIQFLVEMINNSSDATVRAALEKKLRKLKKKLNQH